MKTLILASAFAATLALGLSPAAEAHAVKFKLFFGLPHYGYQVGPDYKFRTGYGWYRAGNGNVARLSCGAAKVQVRNRGYRNVSTIECSGATYTFRATRNGNAGRVLVNAKTGAIWRG